MKAKTEDLIREFDLLYAFLIQKKLDDEQQTLANRRRDLQQRYPKVFDV